MCQHMNVNNRNLSSISILRSARAVLEDKTLIFTGITLKCQVRLQWLTESAMKFYAIVLTTVR